MKVFAAIFASLVLSTGALLAAAETAPQALSPEGQAALSAAIAAFRSSQWDKALEEATKVLGEQPEQRDALYVAGSAESRLDRLDDARRHLRTLVELAPDYPFSHYRLGYVAFLHAQRLAGGGDADGAKAEYSEAAAEFARELERDPKQEASASSRAIALARAGRLEESIASHEAWIALAPDQNAPHVSLAATDALAGRGTEAMQAIDRLPDKSPSAHAEALTTVLKAFTERNDWAGAIPFLERWAKAEPSSAAVRAQLTAAYARALDYNSAAQSLKVLYTLDPSDEDAAMAGGAIEATVGNGAGALSRPGVEPPALLKAPEARNPVGAESVQMRVLVMTQVGPRGRVRDALMVPNRIWKDQRQSGFEQSALDAVARAKFAGGTRDGQPAALWTVVAVKFD